MARHFFTRQLIIVALGIGTVAMGGMQPAQAQTDYDFVNPNNDVVASWHDNSYWDPSGIPNNPGDTATFTRPPVSPSAGFTIGASTDTTVGSILIDSTNYTDPHTFAIDGGGTLIFQDPSGSASYTETADDPLNGSNQRVTVWNNIQVLSDLVMTMNHQDDLNSSSFFNGVIAGSSARTITKEGTANLQLSANSGAGFEGQWIINNGGVRLTGTTNIESAANVTVNSGGQLQLNANDFAPTDNWSIADGGVLTLNGPGASTGGALRFQGQNTHDPRHAFFHEPVVLESDAAIAAGPDVVTGELDNVVSGDGGLIKNGPGTIILSNPANSYAGDTSVDEGILRVTNPIFSDTADVNLISGGAATLDLAHTGTDIIDSFFIDDVAQAVGLWGATGNGLADFTTDWITGDGLLDVQSAGALAGDYNQDGTVDAADYALWRSDPDAYGGDPDGYDDWVDNFGSTSGSSPLAGGSAAIPEPGAALLALLALAGLLTITVRR